MKDSKAVVFDMTPERKEKWKRVCFAYIDVCKREGMNPVESYGCLSFVQTSLAQYIGAPVEGVIQIGEGRS